MKVFVLLIVVQYFQSSFGEEQEKQEMANATLIEKRESNECENIKEDVCSLCLQIPGCSWCTLKGYEHSRCDKEKNHVKFGCPGNHTINPKQNITVIEEPLAFTNQISPKKVTLSARVGVPVTFTVNVRPVENYPVDLYFLMDLSKTMDDDLGNLKSLAGNISIKLKELTNKRRLGFGSFVEKVVPPFVKQELINKSFSSDEEAPYNFRHVLDFTEHDELFKDIINNQTNSRSKDIPEATLDALMQVAACENELGWNPANTTRRIVLIATDAPFHMAGEGKFGGIVHPNDAKCHLTEAKNGVREYSGLEQDYPTVNQVYQRLRESRIQPIFAVSQYGRNVYKKLANSWKALGATYEELNEDSNNIIELIEKSYKEIASTVHITSQPPADIDVRIDANCGNNIKFTDNICQEVGPGETVSFNVTVTAKSCKTNSSSFKLSAAAFGEVEINVNTVCTCECEAEKEYNTADCSGHGAFTCGRCSCNSGWSGKKCECESSHNKRSVVNKCRKTNTSNTVCEGNGECVCNECICNLIENTKQSYYGKYCQCSDLNCDEYKGELCGGETRGACKCGECECKKGYKESNCGRLDCSIANLRCLDKGVNCSNHGVCKCGECLCDSFYEGDVCENCPTCVDKCDDFKQCVLCEVFGQYPANKKLCDDCPPVRILDSLAKLRQYIEDSNASDDSENEYVFSGEYLPYQNEPLASESESSSQDDDELDEDGLSVEVLRGRYEKEVPVDKWCTCGNCNHLHLVGAREYRCCREVIECVGKFTFIGQDAGCITDHEDFSSLTNRTVLLEVAPLLKNKDGKRYRRQPGNTENQFVRAVGYRWLAKWLFGLMGWENTRPLPACLYHVLRSRYGSTHVQGYVSGQERGNTA